MKVLVLSSWYPTPNAPHAGVFVRDQVAALKRHVPALDVAVAFPCGVYWAPRRPLESLRMWCWSHAARRMYRTPGEWRVFPFSCHEWSSRLPGGFPRGTWRGWQRAWREIVRDWGVPDLIHAHVSVPAGWLASRTWQAHGVPYVLTEHMGPFPFPSLMVNGRPRAELVEAFQKARGIIAVSPALAGSIRELGLAERVQVVPNVVDESLFRPKSAHPNGRFTFFFLGHVSEQKGVGTLLQAIAAWGPPKEVRVALGGTADEGQLRRFHALAESLGVAEHVEWLGVLARPEVAEWMRRAHVFVLPSRHESFGVVVLEALASGTPVIATRCGGPDFIIQSEDVGMLVDVGDVLGLANAMRRMMEELDRFSPRRIRAYYEERFSARITARRIAAIYEHVLGSAA